MKMPSNKQEVAIAMRTEIIATTKTIEIKAESTKMTLIIIAITIAITAVREVV